MCEEILFSIGESIAESLGVKLIEQAKKEIVLKKIKKIVKEEFAALSDTSIKCTDFHDLVQSWNFIEMLRNYFLTIEDGMDRNCYLNSLECYISKHCPTVKNSDARQFLEKIQELYEKYLHKIIEDTPSIYALFQLMVISYRDMLGKFKNSEENIKEYFEALESRKTVIEDSFVKLYHQVCEKEFGKIRFTGISSAERKREQNINEFYVQNTFSYYGKEIEKLYKHTIEKIETIGLKDFFELGNKIVLIGGAGLGKSTSLNYLFCNYEKIYGSYALKVKIDLKEYAEEIDIHKKSILWCIANEFIKRTKHTGMSMEMIQKNLSDYLDKGRCLIILDALDEIPALSSRNKVRDEIASFCEIYYLNRFIISTREAGYLRNRFDDTFLHVKINSFNMEQIQRYSKNWYFSYYASNEDFEGFWKKFENEIRRARCSDIISNPIILILALVIFDIEKNLPTRRIEFYDKCIQTFLTERENRKAAFKLSDKANSILSMNLTVPKIAFYKFEHLEDNIGYKFNANELEKAVFCAIGVSDELIWSRPIKDYVNYLVDRTELIQEIDEDIFDFAHKTFYEYFLAFYICKIYDNEELCGLLEKWIGDSNYDELARLIIEMIIQNNEPRQHDFVLEFLFAKLYEQNIEESFGEKKDILSIISDIYNHNMLHPKYYEQYNRIILLNSKIVDRLNNKRIFNKTNYSQEVIYDEEALSRLFCVELTLNNEIKILDSLMYLNPKYVSCVAQSTSEEYILRIIELFKAVKCINQMRRNKVRKKEREFIEKEINYFLENSKQYLFKYPQVFLSLINLSIMIDKQIDSNLFLSESIELNGKFYNYTNPTMLFNWLDKAQKDGKMLLLFLYSVIRCLHKRVNDLFEYIFDILRHKNSIFDEINVKDMALFCEKMWKILNDSNSSDEFKVELLKLNLFEEQYDKIYNELFELYVLYNKGVGDGKIRKYILKVRDE